MSSFVYLFFFVGKHLKYYEGHPVKYYQNSMYFGQLVYSQEYRSTLNHFYWNIPIINLLKCFTYNHHHEDVQPSYRDDYTDE